MYSHSKPPPLGSSPVQTPHSAHSVQLLLLLMLIVPLYFIAVFAVREKKRRKQDQHLREMVVPPNQVKMSNADIDSKILVVDGGGGYVTSNTPTTWNLVVFHPCSRPSH